MDVYSSSIYYACYVSTQKLLENAKVQQSTYKHVLSVCRNAITWDKRSYTYNAIFTGPGQFY